ncbi:2259_t:CDS:1, partial [Dentiscutata erythropus]
MANNQISNIASQIFNTNDLHILDPLNVHIFASHWNKPRTLSGYDALELKITQICNTLLIFDIETIEKVSLHIWEHFTTPAERDVHTNIAFRVNEYRKQNPLTFGPPAPGLMRYHGIEPKVPVNLPLKPMKHTDQSDTLYHGCDFP